MKHILSILAFSVVMLAGIFSPFIHGDYDFFSIGLSTLLQLAAFCSLLFVPIGVVWVVLDFLKKGISTHSSNHSAVLKRISTGATIIVILASALGAFISQNRSVSIVILLASPFILSAIYKKGDGSKAPIRYSTTPYYLILIPVIVGFIRLTFFNALKDQSTNYVIARAEQLIQDIESYKKVNGHYPVSIQSTIEDYRTNVAGIARFHYTLNGQTYNLYFEQFSNLLGTEEIVMYNPLDEHEMTVHNQDLLRIPDAQIIRGYHQVVKLPQPHWKIFYFD